MTASTGICGISAIAYALPQHRRSVRELDALGQLESDPAMLEQLGFEHVYVAEEETPYSLALAAATTLLRENAVSPASIDTLLYCGTPSVAFGRAGSASDASSRIASTRRFDYPATRLQYDLDLECASALAIDQLACTSLFSAVRIARALIETGEARRVLCVSAEFFPECAGREAIYNCTSDAACAVLIDDSAERNRILASAHVTKGYYWDGDARRNEIVASYFPAAKHVIAERALANVVERLRMFTATGHTLSFGVYTFSHNTAHVLAPFAPFTPAAATALLKRLPQPGGGTPLGDTVLAAGHDVLQAKATRKHVLVITDGINTVGPDPSVVLSKLAARAAEVSKTVAFHFVAFDIDARRFAAVKKLGATVVGAADEAQLGEQLTLILEKKILLEEEVPPAPKPKTN